MDLESIGLERLIDQIGAGVYITDRDRKILRWSAGAERISGYSAEQVVGLHCHHGPLQHVDSEGKRLCTGTCPLAHTMTDGQQRDATVFLQHADGHRIAVKVSTGPIRDASGEVVGGVEVFQDHTSCHRLSDMVDELERAALLDPLTELPNRRFIDQELEVKLEEERRYGWPFAVALVDVDHFKAVNDTHGHDVGDAVLQTVSRTLRGASRGPDIVGRWGGEEFLILLTNIHGEGAVGAVERMRAMVGASVTPGEPPVRVTVSIGVAQHRAGEPLSDLIKRADERLYAAKEGGRDRVVGPELDRD